MSIDSRDLASTQSLSENGEKTLPADDVKSLTEVSDTRSLGEGAPQAVERLGGSGQVDRETDEFRSGVHQHSAAPSLRVPQEEVMRGSLDSEVLDSLLEGFQIVSPNYRYIYINRAAAGHGKQSRHDLIGRFMWDCYPGIDETDMFALLSRCMEQRASGSMESKFRFPDGSVGWFEIRFQPVSAGLAILSIDITERKRTEQALRRTNRLLRLLRRSSELAADVSSDEELSRAFCRVLVRDCDYLSAWVSLGLVDAGTPLLLPGSYGVNPAAAETAEMLQRVPLIARLMSCAVETGEVQMARLRTCELGPETDEDIRILRHFGVECCAMVPVRPADDLVVVVTVCGSDAEGFGDEELAVLQKAVAQVGGALEILRAEAGWARASRQFEGVRNRSRAIFERMPHAAFVWQKTEDGFAVADMNEAAERLFDDAGSLLGSCPAAFEIPYLLEDLVHCSQSGEMISREEICRWGSATRPRYIQLSYAQVPPDLVVLYARDVTEQRETEQQLVASQRLEAVGQLAGGVAHDFNNLLSVILTCAGFADQGLEKESSAHEDIQQVLQAGRRASRLTRQLLAFSRKQILEPRPTHLDETIREMEKMFRRILGEDIEILVQSTPELGRVMTDPAQLEQVLMNLVVNARDAMPAGGRLTIATSSVDVQELEAEQLNLSPGRYIVLSVSDTGAGMNREMCDRAFEPFFTTKEHGTGLGLATVFGIVRQSGGNIVVESEPDQGSTFRVYLPEATVEAIQNSLLPPSRPNSVGHEKILVIEDDDALRAASARILASAGYRVYTAGGGTEGIRLVEEHGHFDLLLTDVIMPYMNGREVADLLRARCPQMRVLFTSGYTDRAIVEHGVLEAGTQFISKPFSIPELQKKVRQVLDEATLPRLA